MRDFPFPLPLLLDGSTGVMLQAAGMPEGACTEQWVLEHPDVIRQVQRGYVQAGSQAVYAPTFCGNRVKLASYGLGDKVTEMNRALVSLTRDTVGSDILIGGDMTSLGLFLRPFGDAAFDDFISVYQEQAAALDGAGVDFFIPETLMSLSEARAAVIAIRRVSDKPIFVTITCDEKGRMLSGTPAETALIVLQSMGIDAFGLNCSVGPDAMLPVMQRLSRYAEIPLIVKPNAGLPEIEGDHTVFRLSPEAFTAHTKEFAACGVRIFGGCCGTGKGHIEALAEALKDVSFGETEPVTGMYAAGERDFYELREGMDFGEPITASEFLSDDLMDAEDADTDGVFIHIEDEEGLTTLEENQHLIKKPLRLSAADDTLLEAAFRVYQGRAVCSSSDWSDALAGYGAIILR